MTFSRGSHLERDHGTLTYSSGITGRNSQAEGFEPNKPPGMQQSDLFKAEYVFIVDSEGEDEVPSNKVEQGHPEDTGCKAIAPKTLDVSSSVGSDVVRPKIWGPDLKASSQPQIPQGMATQPKEGQQYKTMPSYKAFAAIPTNTLLLEQKALDEPASSDSISKASPLDLPVEAPTTLPRAPGRETKYANLSSSSTLSESQLTKPGVIRPVPIRSKLSLKKEDEVYEPNPFSKYLEENSDLFSEQLGHPMVAIPEHESFDSKE